MAVRIWSEIQANKDYSGVVNVPTYLKKLMSIKRMSEKWVAAQIKQKEDNRDIFWTIRKI
ncbi:hypothetical protein PVK06_026641 [Gossypium arboreum]|uniref:Uncharacterized protein n=1 Tax=Gossypium arboreum TaxID=29729 RepID=A0ABR0NYR9_GOSAR|nr:hypothetical protein PVK06_026641 [Gossypium arboreum]